MTTKNLSVSPSAQAFMETVRAQAGDDHSTPPSAPPASSGNSGTGSGNSGSSGGTGGGGGGENPSSPKPNPHEGSTTKKALLVVLILSAVCTCIIALSSVFIATRSTTPEGMAQTLRLSELDDKEDARRHAEKMEELKLKQARLQGRNSNAAPPATQSTASCPTVSVSTAKRRADAAYVVPGQCITFAGSSTDYYFWARFGGPVQKTEGVATFTLMREETEVDKNERQKRCMSDNNDEITCNKEMEHRVGVRTSYCTTTNSPDACIGYLNDNTGKYLHVLVTQSQYINVNM